MMDTRLILLDGMTGTGKSTTAQRLWLHLDRLGHNARWFYEHDTGHPIWQTDERIRIADAGAFDPSFVEDILLARWRNLVRDCCAKKGITILEGTLFHSTIGFLVAMNIPDDAIVDHVRAIGAAVAAASPALVYFHHRDIPHALRETFENRQADGYAELLVQYIGRSPYGKKIGLNDFSGLVRFYEHWSRLVDVVLPKLGMATLVIDRKTEDRVTCERRIAEFLGLPAIKDFRAAVSEPSRFVGRYRDPISGDELVVAGSEQGLYIDDAYRTALISAHDGVFHLAATCAEVAFRDERRGCFQSLHLNGNLTSLSPVWIRADEGSDHDTGAHARGALAE